MLFDFDEERKRKEITFVKEISDKELVESGEVTKVE